MPGSANASAAIIPGSDPDHTSDPKVAVTRAPDASSAAETTTTAQTTLQTTDILRIVVTKRRERRLDRRRLGTIFLMAGQTGHHHVEQLGIDKRQRIA